MHRRLVCKKFICRKSTTRYYSQSQKKSRSYLTKPVSFGFTIQRKSQSQPAIRQAILYTQIQFFSSDRNERRTRLQNNLPKSTLRHGNEAGRAISRRAAYLRKLTGDELSPPTPLCPAGLLPRLLFPLLRVSHAPRRYSG